MTLEILAAVEEGQGVTQRHLAGRLGIALGLTNSYLKRCIKKGFVKIHQAPANRYFYYLTPKGFAEKSRLTAQYLSYSLNFYRKAVDSFDDLFARCRQQGWNRLVLYGNSELAEIAEVQAGASDLQVMATVTVAPDRPLVLPAEPDYDVLIVTDLCDPAAIYERLSKRSDVQRVLVPDVLGLGISHQQQLNATAS